MSREEVAAFLDEEKTVVVATNGRDGFPHLMPLWYVCDVAQTTSASEVGPGETPFLWAWTYAASQKVRNLERDPRCTLQVEAGTEYAELRGVMLKAEVVLHREEETVWGVGAALAQRYGGADITPEVEAALRKQAAKRVALEFVVRETASWDHRKLAGAY